MKLTDQKIKEILLKGQYVTANDIARAEERSKKQSGSIVDYLFSSELITKDLLGQAIAESFDVVYADLNTNFPNREQIFRIPAEIAERYRIVLFEEIQGQVTIATDNPIQVNLVSDLKKLFPDSKIRLAYSLAEDIDSVLLVYRKALATRFGKILESGGRIAPEIINEIIADALAYRASDIHFEPREKQVVIRFRIDGVLQEAGRLPLGYYDNIINRIKVQAHLRTDEHAAAQDGAIRFSAVDGLVDLRVSIVPTIGGEKIVMRLLSRYVGGYSLAELGLQPADQLLIKTASEKPFGMILVTGPTGSGKTTSLYGLLKILNRPEINISTIEDPVEYRIPEVNHIQVNPQTNLTFAAGLRSIVRQDPDIILVGEIRDQETAEIAVNAALTGHLLLSTFHANDAATAIPRMLDMGIEAFILSSTLELIIAQRLVRKICESCRRGSAITRRELKKKFPLVDQYLERSSLDSPAGIYEGKGCPSCNYTGYKGRTAIFECIPVSAKLRELIVTNPSAEQIWQCARSQGARSLFEDGIEKVKSGVTTIEELARVASPKV